MGSEYKCIGQGVLNITVGDSKGLDDASVAIPETCRRAEIYFTGAARYRLDGAAAVNSDVGGVLAADGDILDLAEYQQPRTIRNCQILGITANSQIPVVYFD